MSLRLFCWFTVLGGLVTFPASSVNARSRLSQQDKEPPTQEVTADLLQQGKDFLRARQYEKAAQAFKEVIARQPNSAAAYANLGATLLRQDKPAEALPLVQKALELDNRFAFAYAALGDVNRAMNRFAEAIEAYQQAIRLSPAYADAYGAMGATYALMRRYEESLDAFTKAESLNPNNPEVQNGLGIAYYRLGKHEEGIAAVKKAIGLAPNAVNAYINLGNWYDELARYEEAIDAYSQVIRLAPRFPSGYYHRSLFNLYLGRGEMAADDARKFLNVADWYRERSPYMVIVAVLGYQQSNREVEAAKTLDIAVKRCNAAEWPYPVIRYLHQEISAPELLKLATDNDKMTEAQTYIGLKILFAGQRDEALQYFQWVKENGNKTFIEYKIVMTELARSGKKK
ncbi:MAG: tetratricopeptide repeat protein [Acidobacteria bacterium]|nr:tetratricopeptide repeat protein [Acidobacteriota bacterium]